MARSGVIDSVEMMMSALPVSTLGMRVAPVVWMNSSSSPQSLASSCATSTSDPVGFMLLSIMPDGGMARSVEMRIFLACMTSSSKSARAGVAASTARPHTARATFVNLLLLILRYSSML